MQLLQQKLSTPQQDDSETLSSLNEIFRLLDTAICPPQSGEQIKTPRRTLSRVDAARLPPLSRQSLPTSSQVKDNHDRALSAAKANQFFIDAKKVTARFTSSACIPYDACSTGLSVTAPKLEPEAEVLGMREGEIRFSAKQAVELSTILRHVLGILNYQDFAVAAISELASRAVQDGSNIADISGSLYPLLTAVSRTNNDALGYAWAASLNLYMARRQVALKPSKQVQPVRRELLLAQPVMSQHLFNEEPARIKTEVFSETQNQAVVKAISKPDRSQAQSVSKKQTFKTPQKPASKSKQNYGKGKSSSYPSKQGANKGKRQHPQDKEDYSSKKPRFSPKGPHGYRK